MKISVRDQIKDIDVVTVTLVEHRGSGFKMFNCPTCKNPIFQYKGRLVSIVPGYTPTKIPVVKQCSNNNCRQKYLLSTIVSKDNSA